MSEPFTGQITLFANTYPPLDWADCRGQLLPIGQYQALAAVLRGAYGGDMRTTLGLPDLQGRVAVGTGTPPAGSTYALAAKGGVETVTLTQANAGTHTHALSATTSRGSTNAPVGKVLASVVGASGGKGGASKAAGNIYSTGTPNVSLAPASVGIAGTPGAHTNMQPFVTLRYCIALNGIFPVQQ